EAAPMSGESYSRVPDKVSPGNLTRAAPGGKGVGLTDFSTLKRNTFDQYRSGLPMWGDERLDSTLSRRSPLSSTRAPTGKRSTSSARVGIVCRLRGAGCRESREPGAPRHFLCAYSVELG